MPALPTHPYNLGMLIKKPSDIRSSEITPKSLYLRRREFIQASAAGLVAAGFAALRRGGRRAGRWSAEAGERQEGQPPEPDVGAAQQLRAHHQL